MCCSLLSMDNVYFCNKECISRCIYFYVMFPIEIQTYIERICKNTVIVCLGKNSSRFTHNCQVTNRTEESSAGQNRPLHNLKVILYGCSHCNPHDGSAMSLLRRPCHTGAQSEGLALPCSSRSLREMIGGNKLGACLVTSSARDMCQL